MKRKVLANGKSPLKLYAQQLNDLIEIGDWSAVDCIISPSHSHARQLSFWGWKQKPFAVVHNGLWPERHVARTGIATAGNVLHSRPPFFERPKNVGYWSSPDRGLHYLLRAWPEISKREPEARLHVFYELDKFFSFSLTAWGPQGDRARILAREVACAKADPTIIFRGAVDREELADFQNTCRVQAYPYQPMGYCHPAGTFILTLHGNRPVEELTLTDKVLGKSGKWRDVMALRARKYEGKLVRILPACGEKVALTADHPVYVARGEKDDFQWLRADEVRTGDWLFSATPESVPAPTAIPVRRCTSGFTRELPGGRALKVREVLSETTTETVYALTVDIDESYHAGNFLLHNCEGFGGAVNQGIEAGCHVLLTPFDAFPELYAGMVTWLPKNVPEMCAALPNAILSALHEEPAWHREGLASPDYTWDHAAFQMQRALEGPWQLTGKNEGALSQ